MELTKSNRIQLRRTEHKYITKSFIRNLFDNIPELVFKNSLVEVKVEVSYYDSEQIYTVDEFLKEFSSKSKYKKLSIIITDTESYDMIIVTINCWDIISGYYICSTLYTKSLNQVQSEELLCTVCNFIKKSFQKQKYYHQKEHSHSIGNSNNTGKKILSIIVSVATIIAAIFTVMSFFK